MNLLNFILNILWLITVNCLCGFSLYLLWRYLDEKYFSTSEISQLREENKYLREQITKIPNNFWNGD